MLAKVFSLWRPGRLSNNILPLVYVPLIVAGNAYIVVHAPIVMTNDTTCIHVWRRAAWIPNLRATIENIVATRRKVSLRVSKRKIAQTNNAEAFKFLGWISNCFWHLPLRKVFFSIACHSARLSNTAKMFGCSFHALYVALWGFLIDERRTILDI